MLLEKPSLRRWAASPETGRPAPPSCREWLVVVIREWSATDGPLPPGRDRNVSGALAGYPRPDGRSRWRTDGSPIAASATVHYSLARTAAHREVGAASQSPAGLSPTQPERETTPQKEPRRNPSPPPTRRPLVAIRTCRDPANPTTLARRPTHQTPTADPLPLTVSDARAGPPKTVSRSRRGPPAGADQLPRCNPPPTPHSLFRQRTPRAGSFCFVDAKCPLGGR